MSLHIGILYHWAPTEFRESIRRNGLQIGHSRDEGSKPWPFICMATTPSSAWGLVPHDPDRDSWDLWQVSLREGDHLEIRGDFSPYIREVRSTNSLTADRVWFVAQRFYGCNP